MAHDGQDRTTSMMVDLMTQTSAALIAVDKLLAVARSNLRDLVCVAGKPAPDRLETHQYACHALAWFATYAMALRQFHAWAASLTAEGRFGEVEGLILQIGVGEYLSQVYGGIPMSQSEVARLADLGVSASPGPEALSLMAGNTPAARQRLSQIMADSAGSATFGSTGLTEELEMIRDQFRRFSDSEVAPHAHGWHLRDDLIPEQVIAKLAEMGVFGLTIPEAYGGFGLSKAAMVVVSEELSRGHIGVGSLATRSEIAAELILCGGTEAQKVAWLPKIASAETLPTAVFTEPDTGSDLGSLRTRATLAEGAWRVAGNKTWITHAARANLMALLVRTEPDSRDHRGLSLLLAEKPPGTEADAFPVPGLKGGEIRVLGYRGMKEYDLAFDGFAVAAENLLGGVAGQGFRQLMQTFESARIQTAARAIGVAQAALEEGLRYAMGRVQFGKPILAFPRIAGKLALMAVEIMIARQVTYHAAREKDSGRRCDLEAGMAKLLAARVAWSAADNALQIHGGNGFALETPISRILCDARILSIFEGAAEIQAQVIARRLLE